MTKLTMLAPGVYVWLQDGTLGRANAGAVIDADGITVIDTLMVPEQYEPFADAVESLGHPIRRVVLSSSHIQYVGGSTRFWPAAFYGTPATSELLDLPPNVDGYRRLMPGLAHAFVDDLTTAAVSHTVDESTVLTPALQLRVTAGPSAANLETLVAGAGVLFAGGVCVFGTVPLGFEADFPAWIDELAHLEHQADDLRIVPGQGPLGGRAEVAALRAYLEACLTADGDLSRLAFGPWAAWHHPELHEVNVERAALVRRGEDRVPPAMLRLVGLAS